MEVVRPFVKWAGGKGSLISQLTSFYPFELKDGMIDKYVEPFVGGGAVLINILQKYDIKEAYAFDINIDLINCYNVIKKDVESLIQELEKKEKEFLKLENKKREELFYSIRNEYNSYKINENEVNVKRAAEFIFLNRTCFNGLYRVNKSGKFNVPIGSYKNPRICDADNLLKVSEVLQDVKIVCDDYAKSEEEIDENSFVYLDPPYLPIKHNSFTNYDSSGFGEKEQVELSNFCKRIDDNNAKFILSNSDPKNTDKENNFFEEHYDLDKNRFNYERIDVRRAINSDKNKRGYIKELLIYNY